MREVESGFRPSPDTDRRNVEKRRGRQVRHHRPKRTRQIADMCEVFRYSSTRPAEFPVGWIYPVGVASTYRIFVWTIAETRSHSEQKAKVKSTFATRQAESRSGRASEQLSASPYYGLVVSEGRCTSGQGLYRTHFVRPLTLTKTVRARNQLRAVGAKIDTTKLF